MRDIIKYLLFGVIGIGIGIGIGAGIWLSDTTSGEDGDVGDDGANENFPDNGFVKLPVGNFGVLTGVAENGVAKGCFHFHRINRPI